MITLVLFEMQVETIFELIFKFILFKTSGNIKRDELIDFY